MNKDAATSEHPVDQSFTLSPREKKKILKDRAKLLAREPEKEETAEEYLEVAEFLLAYETYAFEMAYIREIYPLKELTPIACTPPFVLGVINVRGQILSVIDIKKFFDLPEKGLGDLNNIIILQGNSIEFGVLADKILGVRSIPVGEIQSSLPTLTDIRAKYLRGVTKERSIILDAKKILNDDRILVHEEAEI